MSGILSYAELAQLANGKAVADVPCPMCSRWRRKSRVKVFRVWVPGDGLATYCCVHCGLRGYALDGGRRRVNRAELRQRMQAAAQHQLDDQAERQAKAQWAQELWRHSAPATEDSTVGHYLRSRALHVLPTLRMLPDRDGKHVHMIAAYGVPELAEPGRYAPLRPEAVKAVHRTRLNPDGSKAPYSEGDNAKRMLGPVAGWPLALVPPGDDGLLVIAEGIENAASLHVAIGCGVWAAGAAGHMPKLAPLLASLAFIGAVHIVPDLDEAGLKGAHELASELRSTSNIDTRILEIELGAAA